MVINDHLLSRLLIFLAAGIVIIISTGLIAIRRNDAGRSFSNLWKIDQNVLIALVIFGILAFLLFGAISFSFLPPF